MTSARREFALTAFRREHRCCDAHIAVERTCCLLTQRRIVGFGTKSSERRAAIDRVEDNVHAARDSVTVPVRLIGQGGDFSSWRRLQQA